MQSLSRQDFEARLERQTRNVSPEEVEGWIESAVDGGVAPDLARAVGEQVWSLYLACEGVARQGQGSSIGRDAGIALAAVLLTTAGAVGILFEGLAIWAAGIEAVLGLLTAGLILWRWFRDSRVVWISARYLAEHARATAYACLGGVSCKPLVQGALRALPAEKDAALWLRGILEQRLAHVSGYLAQAGPPHSTGGAVSRYLGDRWLKDQEDWHLANHRRKRLHGRGASVVGLVALTAVACIAVVQAAIQLNTGSRGLAPWGPLASVVLPGAASAAFLLGAQYELSRVAGRSLHMHRQWKRQRKALETAKDDATRSAVLTEAARSALLENYEWSVLLGTAE